LVLGLGSRPVAPQATGAPAGADPRVLQFSGYDWQVKASQGGVGPGPNIFASGGVWVDEFGRLHLSIARRNGRWECSEIVSQRSFGYGEYRFEIEETAGLDANAVLGLFLWDPFAPGQQFREVDIEVSRWGDPEKPGAQFVIEPFQRPQNLDRFELPPGRAELSFRWTPGRLLCRAVAGGKIVEEHLFTQGVPEPGRENVRLNTWLFRGQPPANGKTTEIVVDRFEFLPLEKGR
jgi:hypothetical protein